MFGHLLTYSKRRVIAIALLLLLPLGLAAFRPNPARASLQPTRHGLESNHWVGTWAAAQQQAPPANLASPGDPSVIGFNDQTVREIVRTSIGGTDVQIHLSNAYSSQPLVIGNATVGVAGAGPAVTSGPFPVTFDGNAGVTIPPGAEAVSDPLPMPVASLTSLAISIYLPQATGPTTGHALAEQVNYISGPGDFTGQTDGTAFAQGTGHWFFLSAVDVRVARHDPGSVVVLGDDLADGFGSTPGANARWPDFLAARLQQSASPMGVLNEGINGNRLLSDSPCLGVSALARLNIDVFHQAGVRTLILEVGENDIGFPVSSPDGGCTTPNPVVTAQQIIDGYRQIIVCARAHGLRIIGTTIPPFGGSGFWSASSEQERQTVNHWIRTSHAFTAIIDFDKVLRDPANPDQLLPAYDSGDHLHPNDAGYQAMAQAIYLGQVH
jgi:lysophospholipase L1-like esterase